MTFCLGIRVREGLLGLSDTRVTAGHEYIKAKKMSTWHLPEGEFFILTSGLRSIRDKLITYFDRFVEERDEHFNYIYEAANHLCSIIKQISTEDKEFLEASGTSFSATILLGGKFRSDKTHHLFLLYSSGNWVEVGPGTPYQIIGETGYGKPVLDRALQFDDDLEFAMKVACLAFDSTRISAADVGLPIDVVLWRKDSEPHLVQHRFDMKDFSQLSSNWQTRLRASIDSMPGEYISEMLSRFFEMSEE
jgi:putative proteasome-type protease